MLFALVLPVESIENIEIKSKMDRIIVVSNQNSTAFASSAQSAEYTNRKINHLFFVCRILIKKWIKQNVYLQYYSLV